MDFGYPDLTRLIVRVRIIAVTAAVILFSVLGFLFGI